MKKVLVLSAALAALAGGASAATLSIVNSGGETLGAVPGNFGVLVDGENTTIENPVDLVPDLTLFRDGSFAEGDGLFVSSDFGANVTFTYIGFEAGYINSSNSVDIGAGFFENRVSLNGDSESYTVGAGTSLVDLAFSSIGGTTCASIANGSAPTAGSGCNLAFSQIFNEGSTVYAMLGDGTGDTDLDDIVVRIDISDVPIPAGGLLLMTGLAGLAAAKRRKKA
jgi:hypothetical protein